MQLIALQNDLRDKISNKASSDPNQERKKAIRAELETLRGDQAGHKATRDKVLAQIKTLQDKISNKGKELQASKGKSPFKSVTEVDGGRSGRYVVEHGVGVGCCTPRGGRGGGRRDVLQHPAS